MPHGQNRTVVHYQLLEGSATLAARPFVTGRDYHGTHRYNEDFNTQVQRHEENGCHISLQPYAGCPPIVWSHDGEWYEGGAWYHSFEYAVEQERGLDFAEDAWCPGAWVWRLGPTARSDLGDGHRAVACSAKCGNARL
jgi:hypothetical protein